MRKKEESASHHLGHLILTSKMRVGCEALSLLSERMEHHQPAYHLKEGARKSRKLTESRLQI